MSILRTAPSILLACSLLLVGCGGSDEGSSTSTEAQRPASTAPGSSGPATTAMPDPTAPTTAAPDSTSVPSSTTPDTAESVATTGGETTEIDRTGYFTATQSEFLNPLLAKQAKVAAKSESAAEVRRCNKVNAAGSDANDAARAASCWLKMGADSAKAIAAVEQGLEDVKGQGEWDAGCIEGIGAAQKALAAVRVKWEVMRDGWARYAKGDYSGVGKLNGYADAAWAAQRTIPKQLVKLSEACYVEADIEAARTEAE